MIFLVHFSGHFSHIPLNIGQRRFDMYRILNPMNHNVSLVRNDKGEEVIVIGKGIAFGRRRGI